MRNNKTLRLTLAALFLALGLLLPFLTGNNRALGNMLSLMHIPVLLCGFVCGPWYGLAIGIATPLLRTLLVGMPPWGPVVWGMTFELGAYGLLAGLLYKALPKNINTLYLALVLSMLGGRLVLGIANYIIFSIMGSPYTLQMFWAAAFVTPVPGIIVHIALIPPVLMALEKFKLFPLKDGV